MDAIDSSLPGWLCCAEDEQAEIDVESSTKMMNRKNRLRFIENTMSLQKGCSNSSLAARLLPAHYGGKSYTPNGL
jgi:hypothetical protein